MKRSKSRTAVNLECIPEDLQHAILIVIEESDPLDALLWWGRWQAGLTLQDLAERCHTTPETIRLTLERIHVHIREVYESQKNAPRLLSPVSEEERFPLNT